MERAQGTLPVAPADARAELRRFAFKLIAGILVFSAVVGVLVLKRLVDSEHHLSADWQELNVAGRSLSVSACVDEVVRWDQRCGALAALCENSASGMMLACLDGQDRSAYCDELGDRAHDTRFGYDDCHSRDIDQSGRTACAFAYRAIDYHCTHQARSQAP